ncbi:MULTISPECIES: TetR/AcrR family transcriptional regulator [Geobacillus]|uniref:TetR family transcriptional regulator n=1 Tax=Geobacillus thermocatenulatus TaxID=33938 RepID=A0A226QE62_9BACL|nr:MULTISPECIES: TetR/AcrR family transcriptional regulator [Geobacillus]AST00676.1 TetR family transcriptional regulator [Geobacillus thermocatenulatus]KLR75105.1 TetR family transcriptional regulator [Geobacillus sp. T6]OXB89907.1 TetR family transcriptional regulator [Geobacillus thermocatenulatus]
MTGKNERYQEILAAARNVFAEKGFDDTKVSEIAQMAGVAKGTFYIYFPSKLDLVLALVREMQGKILSEAEKVTNLNVDHFEKLVQVIKIAFIVIESYRDVFPIFNAVSAFKTDQWKVEKEIRIPYYNVLKTLIENGQKSGEFNRKLNAEMTAVLIVGMVEHVAHDCFIYHSDYCIDDYLHTIDSLLRKALKGR